MPFTVGVVVTILHWRVDCKRLGRAGVVRECQLLFKKGGLKWELLRLVWKEQSGPGRREGWGLLWRKERQEGPREA